MFVKLDPELELEVKEASPSYQENDVDMRTEDVENKMEIVI